MSFMLTAPYVLMFKKLFIQCSPIQTTAAFDDDHIAQNSIHPFIAPLLAMPKAF